MSTTEVECVDRGLVVVEKLTALKKELKGINAKLAAFALKGEQIPLEDKDREGMQYIAHGSKGATVPVIITADSIVQSFKDGAPAHARAEEAAKGHLADFYKKESTWKIICKDGKALRREAAAVLEDDAPTFVSSVLARDKHGVPKTAIKVEWQRDEEEAGPEE